VVRYVGEVMSNELLRQLGQLLPGQLTFDRRLPLLLRGGQHRAGAPEAVRLDQEVVAGETREATLQFEYLDLLLQPAVVQIVSRLITGAGCGKGE